MSLSGKVIKKQRHNYRPSQDTDTFGGRKSKNVQVFIAQSCLAL